MQDVPKNLLLEKKLSTLDYGKNLEHVFEYFCNSDQSNQFNIKSFINLNQMFDNPILSEYYDCHEKIDGFIETSFNEIFPVNIKSSIFLKEKEYLKDYYVTISKKIRESILFQHKKGMARYITFVSKNNNNYYYDGNILEQCCNSIIKESDYKKNYYSCLRDEKYGVKNHFENNDMLNSYINLTKYMFKSKIINNK